MECKPQDCPGLDQLTKEFLSIKDKIDIMFEALVGDPTNTKEKPGFLIRIDRLERSYSILKTVSIMMGGGLITVICTLITGVILRVL
jgi:hypothetical protein